MSRGNERPEKNCLNCGAEVLGLFCQRCGQENRETGESVWDLISHFFKDITHFDGKFFSTIKYLFSKPGFLSNEYLIGRRNSYVNPVKLYVFTSAFFFVVFFLLFTVDQETIVHQADVKIKNKTLSQIEALDSLAFDVFTRQLNEKDHKEAKPMTRSEFKHYYDSVAPMGSVSFTNVDFETKADYDSVLAAGTVKHGWFKRKAIYKQIEINEKYGSGGGAFVNDFSNNFLHSLPQMLFVLLPLFALILKLVYIRHKQLYYVNHGIFAIHTYIFTFIVMLILFGINKLNNYLNWMALNAVEFIFISGIFFYFYKAMRRFYRQRRAKTVFKFLIVCLLMTVTAFMLAVFYVLYSLFKT